MFIDRVKIKVKAGDGGNGVTAFRREKFVPRGGPSGGDGGVGGSVWMESDEGLNTLLHLRYNPEHKAERGRHGEGSNRYGKDGEDATVRVPSARRSSTPSRTSFFSILPSPASAIWRPKAARAAGATLISLRRRAARRSFTTRAARARKESSSSS